MVKSSGYLKLTGVPYGKNQAPLSDQERNSQSVMTTESHDGNDTSLSNQEGSSISEYNQERSALVISPERVPDGSVPESLSDQENYVMALRPEKGLDKLPLRRPPDNRVHVSGSDQGVTFLRTPEKPMVDGFNWRKYGQKLVRGNASVRSYYKCTYGDCPARKQVEHSHDGHITEINYLLKHEHPKPCDLPNQTGRPNEPSLESETSQDPEALETPVLSTVVHSENLVEGVVSHASEIESVNNNPPDSKRQKKENSRINDSVVTKTNYEPRVVVETTSAVDIVNDGYRWRKYGQKQIKGSPYPRSYYRCVNGGCPVKKHVERAPHDEKVVLTTYEGRHDHDMPAGIRTVIQITPGNNNGKTSSNDDESKPQPEADESRGMEMVVHDDAD
uniref:WRKY transcription factor 1-like n=1 Tax=Erigeron canadensis TaxID=72917 RepID=UPI001CB96628|nr:WRKY transcription factor 1-like [Erigeron canadensis]